MAEEDTLVLTAGETAARFLREDYALARRATGQRVWRAPRIASLDQWIADRWTAGWPAEQLLSTTQALLLWVAEIEREDGILSPLACAREALRAERILLDYRIDPTTLPAWSGEQRRWLDWRGRVQRRRREQGWLLAAELPEQVAQGLPDEPLADAPQLHGLDGAQPPARAALLQALRARGATDRAAAPKATTITRTRLATPDLQYRAVAQHVARALADGDPARPPRIVIALADPLGARLPLEGWLREFLAPGLHLTDGDDAVPWRWSEGAPLTSRPLAAAAEAVFALDLQANPLARLSRLLLARPVWPGEARAAAAALDLRLRDLGLPQLSFARLVKLAPAPIAAPLQRLLEAIRAEPARALPSAWSEHLQKRLAALGWPDDTSLDSAAFQTVQELRRRLARLAGLDPMSGPLSIARARQWLGELLRAGFEPRSDHLQPILLTSPEEAAELSCELRLVVDADAAHLPARREPTPFLDLAAQRGAGVPEASAAGRLAAAQQLAARLGAGAQTVALYSAEIDARGAQSRPTPLFAAQEQAATDATSHAERLAAAPAALAVADDPVPPVQPNEQLRGSAGLLQSWFGAPFFAFCRYRLHIEPLPDIPHGLAPQVQGEVLHQALQTLWTELGDRAGLLALDEGAREALIDRVLDPLLRAALPEAETGRVLHALERGRLHDLLRQWLTHEARRIDDFRVIACEQKLETDLAGLPLRLRIDRIDRVQTPAGARLLLIDYKTGANADPRGWTVDRLREPQLPLYAVVLPQMPVDGVEVPLGGIAFGHLKDGHPALATANDWRESLIEDAKAPKLDWLERQQGWATALEEAVRRFLAGEAGLGPSAAQAYDAWLLVLADNGAPDDEESQEDAE